MNLNQTFAQWEWFVVPGAKFGSNDNILTTQQTYCDYGFNLGAQIPCMDGQC